MSEIDGALEALDAIDTPFRRTSEAYAEKMDTIRQALERQRNLRIEDKNGNPMSRYLREQYTSAKPVVVSGEPDAHAVWLGSGPGIKPR